MGTNDFNREVRNVNYALIGCGRISTNHIRAAMENKIVITAVCDVEPERMERLLEKHGLQEKNNIQRFTDYKQMIQECSIDLISIATESGKHAEIAIYCIGQGIPVIIEKPIALSMKDADRIISMAEKNKVKVCVCHQNRFNIAVQRTRRALEAGRFGKISHGTVHVRWNRNHDYYKQASWRGTWENDGGALMNQSIHGLDILRWMLGDDIEEVYGVTRKQFHSYLEAEDVGLAVLRFANGAVATVEGTTNVYPKNLEETCYLFGENGTVKLGGKSMNTIDVWDFSDKTDDEEQNEGFWEKTENIYGNGHISLFADMVQAIRENRNPYVDAYAGRRALELVLAIYKSQKEGRPISLPLDSFSTMDMKGEILHG